VDAFVDAAKVSVLVTGLTSGAEDEKASLLTTFPLAFESAFARSFALGFAGGAVRAGDLKARSSCVDIELSSLVVSTDAGVDTKDLVAAEVLASCELVLGGFSTLRLGMD
jgi:hypothetical protein